MVQMLHGGSSHEYEHPSVPGYIAASNGPFSLGMHSKKSRFRVEQRACVGREEEIQTLGFSPGRKMQAAELLFQAVFCRHPSGGGDSWSKVGDLCKAYIFLPHGITAGSLDETILSHKAGWESSRLRDVLSLYSCESCLTLTRMPRGENFEISVLSQ